MRGAVMIARGKALCYGDYVNTDLIIPARYLNTSSPEELAAHCMEDIDGGFASKVRQGDIVVAGADFGCGSSREHAPIALKAAGVSCVIASSFARIFYRNAINIGLPIVVSREAAKAIANGDEVGVDFENGLITDYTNGKAFAVPPFPPFIQRIIKAGGLINMLGEKP